MLDDIGQAREIADSSTARQSRAGRCLASTTSRWKTSNRLAKPPGQDRSCTLNIILRADVRGSIEAIQKELAKLEHPEVKVKLLQRSVGGISEADVTLAHASDAIDYRFQRSAGRKGAGPGRTTGVQIRRYDMIYKITDDLKLRSKAC